ncbi:MAG: hypothetical protein ABIJ34_03795 [archaeon]
MKKAQIWVSVIIYTMVAISTVMLLLNTGVPILTEMKDRAVYEKVKEIMLDLDKQTTDLAGQGEGSQSSASLDVREGKITFDNNEVTWEIETKTPLISPRSSSNLGNLIISSNANVRTIDIENYYILETSIKNDSFRVVINKKGNENSWVFYNTSDLIENISFNGDRMAGKFYLGINNMDTSKNGTGYTKMYPEGNYSHLGSAKIIAHVNSTFAEYDIEFILESYADFLTTKIKNIRLK